MYLVYEKPEVLVLEEGNGYIKECDKCNLAYMCKGAEDYCILESIKQLRDDVAATLNRPPFFQLK